MLAGQVVQHVLGSAPLRLQCRHHLQHQQRRGDPVLVLDRRRVAAVAQRLLITEPQPGNFGDPFEPGQRGGVPQSGVGGDALQQRSGDNRLRIHPADRRAVAAAAFGDPPPQQSTDLVTGEHPVVRTAPDAGRAPVGIGIVGDDHIRELGAGVSQR